MPQVITPEPDLHVRIDVRDLMHPDAFSQAVPEARRGDAEDKSSRLTNLLEHSFVRADGEAVSVFDAVLDAATDPALEEARSRARVVSARIIAAERQTVADEFDVIVSPDDLRVKDVFKVTHVPHDARAEEATRRSMNQVGYGPKQNSTSGRSSSPVNPASRH